MMVAMDDDGFGALALDWWSLLAKLSLAWSGCVLCLSLMSTESLIVVLSLV